MPINTDAYAANVEFGGARRAREPPCVFAAKITTMNATSTRSMFAALRALKGGSQRHGGLRRKDTKLAWLILLLPHDYGRRPNVIAAHREIDLWFTWTFSLDSPTLVPPLLHNSGGKDLRRRANSLTPKLLSPNRFQMHNMPLLALGHRMALSLLALMLATTTHPNFGRSRARARRVGPHG